MSLFLLLFETLSAQDISVPFTSPPGRRFVHRFSHSNRVHKTQLGNNMLTFVKVLVQANQYFEIWFWIGDDDESESTGAGKLGVRSNAGNGPFLPASTRPGKNSYHDQWHYNSIRRICFQQNSLFTSSDSCCFRILLPTENRLLLLRSLSSTELSHLRLRRMFQKIWQSFLMFQ